MPIFSVIVVAYAGDKALIRVLKSILEQDFPRDELEICVVENRPHPVAKAALRDEVDVWLSPGENLGASGGRNLGAKQTTAPILSFVDDDGVVDRSYHASYKQLFLDRESLQVARGKVLALYYPMACELTTCYDLGNEVRECLMDLEGALCIRRDVFESVDGFDPNVFNGEGIELMGRILEQDAHAICLYNPGAILYHDFAKGFWGIWKKGNRVTDSSSLTDPLSDKVIDRMRLLKAKYPVQRPALTKRLYKGPAEIVYRTSQWFNRIRRGG